MTRIRPGRLWKAFIRFLIGLLLAALGLVLLVARFPGLIEAVLVKLPLPGVANVPAPGPLPPAAEIGVPRGDLPDGILAYWGTSPAGQVGCSSLLQLPDGQFAGIGAAHATPLLLPTIGADLLTPDQSVAAHLSGQADRGHLFIARHLSQDYVIWTVKEILPGGHALRADERGAAQPGETVVLLSPVADESGNSKQWTGVVFEAGPEATWVRMEAAFDPRGYSGCPVASLYTGQLVGMAVAGQNLHPTVIGLHPVGSLLEKALQALKP
jgi:hypothetical protein